MGKSIIALIGAAGLFFSGALRAAENPSKTPDFSPGPLLRDAREQAAKTPSPGESPVLEDESSMDWIVMENADALEVRRKLDLTRRSVQSVGSRLSMFPVKDAELPKLAEAMHDSRGRCGGFFAYSSREEALADMRDAPAAPVPAYTLERPEDVRLLAGAVREPRLRAVIEKLSSYHNRYFSDDTGVESSTWIKDEWAKIAEGRPDISVETFSHSWKQPSVIAVVRGTREPDTVLVLGGHADSIGGMWGGSGRRAPGADDNASGIAVLTETLRVLVETGYRPERTVYLIAYAAEEVGLRGSREIAADFARRGVKVAGVLQFDMTSFAGSGEKIFLIDDFTSAEQNAYLGKLIDAHVGVPWGTTRCGYGCSDHASWTKNGFPASFPFEATKEDANRSIHTTRDTLDSAGGTAKHAVNFAKLAAAYLAETAKASSETRQAWAGR